MVSLLLYGIAVILLVLYLTCMPLGFYYGFFEMADELPVLVALLLGCVFALYSPLVVVLIAREEPGELSALVQTMTQKVKLRNAPMIA